MKSLLTAIGLVLLLASVGSSQNLLYGPESVAYDSVTERYYVSSLSGGDIVEIDQYGKQRMFLADVSNPFGNHLVGRILYYTSGQHVFGLNVDDTTIVSDVHIPSSIQLDGVAADTSGFLYVMETQYNRIYKIDLVTDAFSVFVSVTATAPQDIVFDEINNRLLLCAWSTDSPILAISCVDSTVSTLVAATPGFCDGITMDGDGNVYIGSYGDGGAVWMYSPPFTDPPEMISDLPTEPAGLWYDRVHDVLAVPDFSAAKVHLIDMYVGMDADTTMGWAPAEIQFQGESRLTVDEWSWTFGDGGGAATQDAAHTYTEPGVYDVTVSIVSGTDGYSKTRTQYVGILADTIMAPEAEGAFGEEVPITISLTNHVPVTTVELPVVYAGAADLSLTSYSKAGLRTDGFDAVEIVDQDEVSKQVTVRLTAGAGGALAPGAGPVITLYFQINSVTTGASTPISLAGYDSFLPLCANDRWSYNPQTVSGNVTKTGCCGLYDPAGLSGNVDYDPEAVRDLNDILLLAAYAFLGGDAPVCLAEGNVDGDPSCVLELNDILKLASYAYLGGDPPAACMAACE